MSCTFGVTGIKYMMKLCVCVAILPMSTAIVMAGQSVQLTTIFSWASLNNRLTSTMKL